MKKILEKIKLKCQYFFKRKDIAALEKRLARLEHANIVILKRLLQLSASKPSKKDTKLDISSSVPQNIDDKQDKPTYH